MKCNTKKIVYLGCWLILFSIIAEAGGNIVFDYSTDIDYTSDAPLSILKTNVTRDRSFSGGGIDSASQTPTWLLSERSVYVNGYHKDANGLQYFSFDTDVVVQGPFGTMTVVSNSILKCDDIACASVSIFFTFDRHVKINAFSIDVNGDIVFSVDQATTINGIIYFPADLIRRKNSSGNYSLELDSSTFIGGMALGNNKNIDAISIFHDDGYIYSLKNVGCFAFTGLCYTNSDIFIIDPVSDTHAIIYSPNHFGEYENPVNISSLMFSILSDAIFSDGFE